MPSRDGVVRTPYAALNERPEAFDGIGMNVSAHVDTLAVVNPAVLEAMLRQRPVGVQLVRVDRENPTTWR